jgi:hypothetical protein
VVDGADADVYEESVWLRRRDISKEHGARAVSSNVTALNEGCDKPAVIHPEHTEGVYFLSATVDFTIDAAIQPLDLGKTAYT